MKCWYVHYFTKMGSISDKNIKKCIAVMKYIFSQEKEVTQNIIIIVMSWLECIMGILWYYWTSLYTQRGIERLLKKSHSFFDAF